VLNKAFIRNTGLLLKTGRPSKPVLLNYQHFFLKKK